MSAPVLALLAAGAVGWVLWGAPSQPLARRRALRRLAPGRGVATSAPSRRPVTVLAVVSAGLVAGLPAALAVALVAAALPRVRSRAREAQRAVAYADAVPDALEAIGRSLRAGHGTRAAVAAAASTAPTDLAEDLRDVVSRSERGEALHDSLDRWAASTAAPGVVLAVAALSLAADAGGDAARSVDDVAATLRERAAVRRELRALAAQARLSAVVIAVAPVAFAVVAAAADPGTAHFLLATPLGGACLVLGVGLDLAAWAWMDRITRSVA